ncbi:MAG TPA: hypothetical protein VIH83_02895, partial [Candidatus Bathyarchaeia archaeon]
KTARLDRLGKKTTTRCCVGAKTVDETRPAMLAGPAGKHRTRPIGIESSVSLSCLRIVFMIISAS